jgi:hypothetical protein
MCARGAEGMKEALPGRIGVRVRVVKVIHATESPNEMIITTATATEINLPENVLLTAIFSDGWCQPSGTHGAIDRAKLARSD